MSVIDRTYARALYAAAAERDRVAQVREDLTDVVAALRDVPELKSVVLNPQIAPQAKADVLEAVSGETDELVRNFLRLLVEKGRAASIEGVQEELERLVAAAEGQLTVSLTTAYELSDEEAEDIVARIERASGRRVEAVRDVDPDLIGGIVLQAGSLRADASVRGRLERMRQELLTR